MTTTKNIWHMTCCGRLTLSQNFRSLAHTVRIIMFWRLGEKGWPAELINEWISDKGVFRTAPATPGMLNILKAPSAPFQQIRWGDKRAVTEINFVHVTTKTWAFSRVFGFKKTEKKQQKNCRNAPKFCKKVTIQHFIRKLLLRLILDLGKCPNQKTHEIRKYNSSFLINCCINIL